MNNQNNDNVPNDDSVPSVTSKIAFLDGGDPSLSLSLSTMTVFTKITSILVNIDAFTLKFDEGNNTSIIMKDACNYNDIIHSIQCVNKKEGETSQCVGVLKIFLLVFVILYLLMEVARRILLPDAILDEIYLFSCVVNGILLVLAEFDEFNSIECDTTMNYHLCVVLLFFNEYFSYFVFVRMILIPNPNRIAQTQKIHDNQQILRQLQYILIVIGLIEQVLNILNGYLSVIQVPMTIACEIRLLMVFVVIHYFYRHCVYLP